MKAFSLILLLSALITTQSSAKTTEKQSKLFLVGGGLKTCSSMASKNCISNTLAKNSPLSTAKTTSLYKINEKIIKLLKNSWPNHFNKRNFLQIVSLLEKIDKKTSEQIKTKAELKSLLRKYDRKRVISKLNDAEYFLLFDLLEQPVLAPNSQQRLKEHVDLSQSTHVFSTEIYQRFVALAREISNKETPNIVVITASARDPFEAADFYQAVFQQAGGNTQWLPLDATLNSAFQQHGDRKSICKSLPSIRLKVQGSINRELVYPDLSEQQYQACLSPETIIENIANADGIFINGGDQSLTAKAFLNDDGTDSKTLALIKQKLANNTLIIGGTSAGTAVMSGGKYNNDAIVMITNGQSNTAIVRGAKKDVLPQEGCQKTGSCDDAVLNDDLTYNSAGGLGLFHWGIMDTHFSERGRQGRLATLVLETNTRFAFGVDEATALIVSEVTSENPNFEVVGESGVFVVENNFSMQNKTLSTHYITRGDKARLDNQQFRLQIADWKNMSIEKGTMPSDIEDIFSGSRYQLSAKVLCRTLNKSFSATTQWRKTKHSVQVAKANDYKDGFGAISFGGVDKGYCSYQNYQLSIIDIGK